VKGPPDTRRLKVLEEDASVCDSCGLCQGKINTVFSRGSPYASLMFVGEAPGENEDMVGKPFVGPSGELLDQMVTAMELDPGIDIYVCNAIKCRPENNRRPTYEELAACKPYLIEQIRIVQPDVIVALGKSASYALSDDVPLELLFPQGWAGKWREYLGIPVITTYHPAYLLRTPSAKKTVGRHLYAIKEKLNGK
jgi:uracil-DNA glycosylase